MSWMDFWFIRWKRKGFIFMQQNQFSSIELNFMLPLAFQVLVGIFSHISWYACIISLSQIKNIWFSFQNEKNHRNWNKTFSLLNPMHLTDKSHSDHCLDNILHLRIDEWCNYEMNSLHIFHSKFPKRDSIIIDRIYTHNNEEEFISFELINNENIWRWKYSIETEL